MSNNRMYLCCRRCKEKFLIGKGFALEYQTRGDATYTERLNEFMDDHSLCDFDNGTNVHVENIFELVYEHAMDDSVIGETFFKDGKWQFNKEQFPGERVE